MYISRTFLFFGQLFIGDMTMTPIYAQMHANIDSNQLFKRTEKSENM